MALIESNPRQVTESGPQALFQAAAYPEAIAAVAAGTGVRHNAKMEDVASVLAGDTHVADEAGCDADARRVLVRPLAERDQAMADEV
jgi:hypothetical protein